MALATRDGSPTSSRHSPVDLLLVEDEPAIADFLIRGLRANGYRVTHTENGSCGHRLAESDEFSLLILDWMIPGKPGRLVFAALKDSAPQLPIIVMSASQEAARHVAREASRSTRFIRKPFAMPDLLTLIGVLLGDISSRDDPSLERRPTVPRRNGKEGDGDADDGS